MTKEPTSVELVQTVADKNRKLKIAAIVCMALVLIGLGTIVFISLSTLGRVNTQLAQQKALLEQQNKTITAISNEADQRTQQLAKISSQIDCIAQFFTQRNRTNVVITDLQQCKILNPDGTSTQGTGGTLTPKANSGSAGQTPTTAQPNQPQQPTTPNTPTLPGVPSVPATPDPVRILGVPVCLPLTSMCVRR